MRGLLINAYGEAPALAELPDLDGRPGAARMLAAGINPADLAIATGGFYAVRPEPPYTPGLEGVAERAGGLVYFGEGADPQHGALAEQTLLDPAQCIALPAGTDPAAAIACGVAGLAGWLAVRDRGALRQGEAVVVLGATGAAGRIAVQAAVLGGASHVVAAGRSWDGLGRASELGATASVPLTGDRHDDAVALRDACNGGADLIIDFTWGEPAMAALQSSRPQARLVQAGSAAGPVAPVAAPGLRAGSRAILGYSNFNVPLARRTEAFTELLGGVSAGRLQVDVERVALKDAPAAWGRQSGSPGVKLVVELA